MQQMPPKKHSRQERSSAYARGLLWGVSLALLVTGCSKRESPEADGADGTPGQPSGRLWIYHAASLSRPFEALEKAFEAQFPGVDLVRESSSSRMAIRKVTELNRKAGVVASADIALLRELMIPQHAAWGLGFARNRVVIAYTSRSRARNEINADNWYDVLLRDDVRFGYCNPNMAPVGYRTLLTWQLAEQHYAQGLNGRKLAQELIDKCPKKHMRPHCNELIPLLESLSLDYTFQYRSVALQHHLEWLQLPDEVDLGSETLSDTYARARVEIAGPRRDETITRVGKPIIYGITIPKSADNLEAAQAFLALLLSPEGNKMMVENFQEPISPPLCDAPASVPAPLRTFLQEKPQ
jgi:molybdate/tungstate transport system substrate-binding protein